MMAGNPTSFAPPHSRPIARECGQADTTKENIPIRLIDISSPTTLTCARTYMVTGFSHHVKDEVLLENVAAVEAVVEVDAGPGPVVATAHEGGRDKGRGREREGT